MPAPEVAEGVILIRLNCSGCHTLDRIKRYSLGDWYLIVNQMRAYGLKITDEEAEKITEYLMSKKPY